MTPEQLFARTLDELQKAIYSRDEFHALQASKHLRQLLLEAMPLPLLINRSHGLKLLFEIAEVQPPASTQEAWYAGDELDPRTAPAHRPRTRVKLERFLALTVACVDGFTFTVHDVIDYFAHVAGGVHYSAPAGSDVAFAKLSASLVSAGQNAPAALLRSIGRVVLDALGELRFLALGLSRFENVPGQSIHLVLILHPAAPGRENYLLDIGEQDDRNRLSLFIDSHGDLCLRVFGAQGARCELVAGPESCAYSYGRPMYLACEVGIRDDEVIVSVNAGAWNQCRVFEAVEAPRWASSRPPLVVGSDLRGRADSSMDSLVNCIYPRTMTMGEYARLWLHFHSRLNAGDKRVIEFRGNQFLHTPGHPHFASASKEQVGAGAVAGQSESAGQVGLVMHDVGKRPIFRILE